MYSVILARFPALPASVSELLRLTPYDALYYEKVLKVCCSDPGMASEVMRMAHGSGVAPAAPIRSVRQALLQVGPRPIVNHLLGGMFIKVFVPVDGTSRQLWMRCIRSAAACASLVKDYPGPLRDSHAAHTAGLLHDIGQLALACVDQVRYHGALEAANGLPDAVLEQERKLYGADHAAIGGKLAEAWGFGETLTYVVRYHHNPSPPRRCPAGEDLCRLISFASALLDTEHDRPETLTRAVELAAAAGIPLAAEDFPAIRSRIESDAALDLERLGLIVPSAA
jgi:HD-like signal output (HDOD) protein